MSTMTSTATANRICRHRTRKVVAILAAIRHLQADSDEYARLIETGDIRGAQRLITTTAHVNTPSVETWKMVTNMIDREGRYVA